MEPICVKGYSATERGGVPLQRVNPKSEAVSTLRISPFTPERSICHQLANCLDVLAWILGA